MKTTYTMEHSLSQIAEENPNLPGIKEGIRQMNLSDVYSFRSWAGEFKDYFSMLSGHGKYFQRPIKEMSSSALWRFIAGMDNMKFPEAVNLLIKPVADSLTLQIKEKDGAGIPQSDLAVLTQEVAEVLMRSEWLDKKNTLPLEELNSAAAEQWVKLYSAEQEAKNNNTPTL